MRNFPIGRFPLAEAFWSAWVSERDPGQSSTRRNMYASWFDQIDRQRADLQIPSALVVS